MDMRSHFIKYLAQVNEYESNKTQMIQILWTLKPTSSDVTFSFQFSNSDPPNTICLIPT